MRDRADAADARHEAGHFVERAAFAEALKTADLRDVKVRVFHLTLAVELDGDLAVAFKAGYRIDGDGLAHNSSSKAGQRRNIQRPAVHQRGERGVKCVG